MKLLLPSVAVMVLGVVLAWPQIQFQAERLAGELASLDPRTANTRTLVNARFHGVDTDNQPYTLIASKAVEQVDDPDQVDLWDPEGDIALETGRWLALRGNTGLYSKGDRTLYLDGNVVLYRDDGFEFHTETAHIDLNTKNANGSDPVQGSGPDGTIESMGFDIVDGGRVVVFTGQAHLVLTADGEIAP
ncbi:LPS export ABC transporter periplasmic protein LptC [Rhodospira trueperi]|nr:LPS export ABC transporter periplasmic protein LptC [Rhodospira trueperi]